MFLLSSVCLQVCTGVCWHGVGARRRCARRIVRATRRVSTRAKRGFQPAVGVPRLVGASSTPAAPLSRVGQCLPTAPSAPSGWGPGCGGTPEPWQRAVAVPVGCSCLCLRLCAGNGNGGQVWGRGGDHGAGGRAASMQRLAGSGAGLWCTDGRVIKNNKRKETWIRYSLSTLIVLWGPNHNRVLLEGIQKRNQTSRSVQS